MRTSVPRPLVLLALLFMFAAEDLTFLPAVHAQTAQAGAVVPVGPQSAVGRQILRGLVPAVVAGLQPEGRLPATDRLSLAIGLPLRNQQALTQLLQQISDPAHPNYRHYLTPGGFADRFGPTEQDYQAVIAFAQANGLTVTARHPNRTLLDVNGSVADIEKTLRVTMHVYQHPTEARTFYAPDGDPALDLAVPVLGISGLNNYALPRPRLKARALQSRAGVSPAFRPKPKSVKGAGETPALHSNAGSGPSGTYMGNDFRAAYLPGVALTGAGQVVGLLQFDGYTPSDIIYYENQNGLPNVPLLNVLVDGATGAPSGSGGEVEVSLDIEMAISMAPGLAQVIVYMAPNPSPFDDLLNRMATDNLAKQLSCSWYIPGGGPDPVADQIFQQMAAQGQSFFNASGDYDAFTGPVDFPGETPYIVQVGGTTLTTSGPGGAWVSETVWNWGGGIGSGGGISTRYTIPSYQADISMTLNEGSTMMRNIPDVALTADNVYVRVDGSDWEGGGTSCAAPLWAGFTALVNQKAVASGRPTVGFINPAVDAIGHAANYTACFHDIITGNNTSPSSPSQFYAVTGYDLCTGWGTPAGQNLINALANPDPLSISPVTLAFAGNVGGPFSPSQGWLTLTNTGTNGFNWTLVNTSAWFDVSPTSGTLLPGGPAASVSVLVDPSAAGLSAGVYGAALAFTNQTSGVGQTIPLALSVAVVGMADNFDPGIDLTQWSSFGGVVGSTVLATNYGGSVSAPNSLWFGASGSRYATTVPINTSGGGQIGFCIRLANGTAWPWAIVGNLPADGVVLECSTNGAGGWTAIGNYVTPAYYNWTGVALPIPVVAQAPAALFRWRQLSNSGTNYEHWALDNVIVATGSMAPKIVMDPQSQNVATGNPASLSVAAVGTPPLSYQWLLNGTNINGATASSLGWSNVQLTDAGSYSVLLSNSVGTVVSSNAVLTVYVPVCTPPPVGLVSWWRGEGNALDQVGGNNGVLENGVGFVGGRVGLAFSFNASSNSYVEVADSPTLRMSNALTLECWAKRLNTSQVHILVAKGGTWNGQQCDYLMDVNDTDSVGSHFSFSFLGGWRGCGVTPDSAWHHYAAVAVSGQTDPILYIDGVPQTIRYRGGAGTMTLSPTTRALHIGALVDTQTGWLEYSDTMIDEAAIFNRALSAAEIQAIYNAGSAGMCLQGVAPSITTQPASQTVVAGSNVSFTATVAGTPPLNYQWCFGGTNIAGATGTSLTLSNVQPAQAGNYTLQVANAYGTAISSNALLTVNPASGGVAPWITTQPASQTVVAGANATFTATAAGTLPLSYQWWFGGSNIAGATSTSITLSNVQPAQAGNYTLQVTNAYGTAMSSNAALTVNPTSGCASPPTGLVSWWRGEGNALDQIGGNNGVLENGVGFGGGIVGQAFSFNASSNSYVEVADSPTLELTNALTIECWAKRLNTSQVHILVAKGGTWNGQQCDYLMDLNDTDSVGSHYSFSFLGGWRGCAVTPDSAWHHYAAVAVSGQANPILYVDGVPQPIVFGGGAGTMTLSPTTRTLHIGALVDTQTGWLEYSDTMIDEAAIFNRALSAAEIQAIYNAGSAGMCLQGVAPSITTQPASQTVVAGSNVTFTATAAGTLPLSYQWWFGGSNIAGATGTSLTLSNVQPAEAGNYTLQVTNAYGTAMSSNAVLTVNPASGGVAPTITIQPASQTVVVGSNVTFTAAATGTPPLSYQWWFGGTNIAGATGTSLTLSNVQPAQAGNYTLQVTNAYGAAISSNAVLTVNPASGCASPPSGLVSWWRGEGNAVDSVGSNSGTLVGGVSFGAGEVGMAFSFNGSSYVSVPSSASLNFTNHTPMSVETWVFRTGSATTMHLLGMRSGCGSGGIQYQLSFDPSNGLVFIGDFSGPWASTHQTLAMNQWQHLAVTYDGTMFIFYINGNPVTTVAGYLGAANGQALEIGDSGSCANFVGLIDEVSVYNRALAATEVQAIYNAGSAGKCLPAPAIQTPPQSQTVQFSTNAKFSVTATGLSPLAYQWYFGPNLIQGATNTLLTLTNVGFAQTGNYSVVVTNVFGSATGGPAVLTVVDTIPPTIISCASNQTLSVGANCTATLPDLTSEVIATDASGPVTVTQNPLPGTQLGLGITNVAFTVQDSSGNTSSCASSVTAADTTPPFVLACVLEVPLGFDTNCQALLPDLTGTNYIIARDNCSSVSIVQAPAAQTALPAGTNVVVLTISDASSNQTTRTVNVIVAGPPQISAQPTNLSAVLSSNAAFNVTACGSLPLSYQWQHIGTNLPVGTNAVLALSHIGTNDAGDYQVVITNSVGSITSAVATLTVLQPPVINSLSLNLTTFMLTVPTEVGSTYDLEYKDTLEDPSWKVLTTFRGTGWPIELTDDGVTNTTRFYRIRVY